MFTKGIKDLIKNVENQKKVIAKERDKLRTMVTDLSEFVESIDMGIENIEVGINELNEGMRDIEIGVDDMSKYI